MIENWLLSHVAILLYMKTFYFLIIFAEIFFLNVWKNFDFTSEFNNVLRKKLTSSVWQIFSH